MLATTTRAPLAVTLPRRSLIAALDVVSSAVAHRATTPILRGVRIESAGGHLRLSATNLEQAIATEVAAMADADGVAVVTASLFDSVLSSLAGEAVTLEIGKSSRLTIRSGRNVTTLATHDPEDWPSPAEIKPTATFTVPGAVLASGLEASSYAISKDESRPALTGLLVEVQNGTLSLVSADSFRLALWRYEVQSADCAAIVPGSAVKSIQKLAKAGDVTVEIGTNRARFSAGETTVETRLVDATYPGYRAFIPSASEIEVKVDADQLARTVEAVMQIGRVGIVPNLVRITLADGAVAVSAVGPDGEARDAVAAEIVGKTPFEIGLNGNYLIGALNSIHGECSLSFTTKDRPVRLAPTKPNGALSIAMPMHLKAQP